MTKQQSATISFTAGHMVFSGDLDIECLRDGRATLWWADMPVRLHRIQSLADIGPAVERQMRGRQLGALRWWQRILPWLRTCQ